MPNNYDARDIATKLIDKGYTPIPIPQGQKRPTISGWHERTFTPDDFGQNNNVGIRTGDQGVGFLDIDIYDPEIVGVAIAEFNRRFENRGPWMQRTGQAPKTGFLLRTEPGAKKRQIKLSPSGTAPEGKAEQIEVLLQGQQFIAFGTHPDTHEAYAWGDLDPLDSFLGDVPMLPEISLEEIDDFLDWAEETFGSPARKKTSPSRFEDSVPLPSNSDFWLNVNDAALSHLDAWVPKLLPLATKHATGAWRVTSAQLGRDLEEDLSIHPEGIQDFGEEVTLTPIDLVKQKHAFSPKEAAFWLCDRLGVRPEELGWAVSLGAPMNNFMQVERTSRFFKASDLLGEDIPRREWLVENWIPMKTVSSLYGDGGTGKSLVALQLAVSVSSERAWLDQPTRHGAVLYISAEDDREELHRRTHQIALATDRSLEEMSQLHLRSLAGEDALLATMQRDGTLNASSLFNEIEKYALEVQPTLVVLDTLADLFPGNENDRSQARQFIGLLRGLAIRSECAVLLLAHPSLSGMNSGSGSGGNTAWNNSVRARMYLERVVLSDSGHRFEPNPDVRTLSNKKSNYGRTGAELQLIYDEGVFRVERQPTGLDALAARRKAERVFLKLLDAFTEQGRNVSASPCSTYAPKMFAQHPDADGCTKRVFTTAMEALFGDNKIKVVEDGPPSKRRKYIARATLCGKK